MLEDFQSLLLNGTTQRGTSPQAQIQYADGSGQTGERDLGLPARARVPKERGEPAVVKANGTSLSRVVATRHRDVMVVTYDTHHEGERVWSVGVCVNPFAGAWPRLRARRGACGECALWRSVRTRAVAAAKDLCLRWPPVWACSCGLRDPGGSRRC
jgi:hypothetical protein